MSQLVTPSKPSSTLACLLAYTDSLHSPPESKCRPLKKYEFSSDNQVVGKGANSEVTKGRCGELVVAIKTFKAPVDLDALRREAQVMQLSESSNLVRLVGWCEEPGFQCLVMEYFPLGSLRQVLHSIN
jgi:hypothetical protein